MPAAGDGGTVIQSAGVAHGHADDTYRIEVGGRRDIVAQCRLARVEQDLLIEEVGAGVRREGEFGECEDTHAPRRRVTRGGDMGRHVVRRVGDPDGGAGGAYPEKAVFHAFSPSSSSESRMSSRA